MDARGRFGKYETEEPCAIQASRVFSKLPNCIHNSIHAQTEHTDTSGARKNSSF